MYYYFKICQKSPTFSQKFVLFRKYDNNNKYLAKMEKNLSSFFSPFPDFDEIFTFFKFGRKNINLFLFFHGPCSVERDELAWTMPECGQEEDQS
jgi:hypothetical protein